MKPGRLAVSLALLLTGCSIAETGPTPAGAPASGLTSSDGAPAPAVHLYFHSAEGLERVSRLYRGPDPTQAALQHLVEGPTAAERARGLTSAVPHDAPTPTVIGLEHGTIDILVPPAWGTSRAAERQLVCTAADGSADIRVRIHRTANDDAPAQHCTH